MSHKHILLIISIIVATFTSVGIFKYTHQTPIRHYLSENDKTLADIWQEARELAKSKQTNNAPSTVTFLAVGDISLSRNIAQTIKSKNDVLYPFHGVDELLRSTDFNFGNLETPFSKSDTFTARDTLVFNAPKANVPGLKEYNFKILNLANNHAFDQGLDGINTTTKILDDNGLFHMGTGGNLDEAWQPAIIEKNGIKIGFIGASYSSLNDGGKGANNYVARIEDIARLKSHISSLKSLTDFIVVTMHAGTEYTATANDAQIKFAHAAIDAGADIVIGAHPHWVQEKELYCPHSGSSPFKGEVGWGEDPQYSDTHLDNSDCKWIYYSLGNFIFDQSWSEQTKKGLALKITLSKSNSSCHREEGSFVTDVAIPDQHSNEIASRGLAMTQGCVNDLQPAQTVRHSLGDSGGPKPNTTIQTIQEIPIYIKENCCPVAKIKS